MSTVEMNPLTRQPTVRSLQAEIAELKAKLAAKGDTDDKTPGQDEDNPSDVDDTDVPKKKGKKKTKPQADDDEGDTGGPDKKDPEDDDPERPAPAPPKENKDKPEKDAYRAQVEASVAAILDADARRRGVLFPDAPAATSDDAYWRRVNASVAAIVAANNRAAWRGRKLAASSGKPLIAGDTSSPLCAAWSKARRRLKPMGVKGETVIAGGAAVVPGKLYTVFHASV
jgi:hypothetical protein